MPPRASDPGEVRPPRARTGSTRRDPAILLAVTIVLLALRVALHVQENRAQPAVPPSAAVSDKVQWRSLESGVAEARTTGKPILYDFTADWCAPCRLMQREIFADAAAAADLERRFVPIRVLDRAREDGRNPSWVDSLQARYRVGAFPTLVVAQPYAGAPVIIEGYLGRDYTLDRIEDARRSLRVRTMMPALPDRGR
ncbi:MAG TPA: thioredoxin family protein [Terriglobales bacterium]|nr:thioredoxin family protein [Terriglobales bacterium]